MFLADSTHLSGSRKQLAAAITVLAMVALGLSLYLTWVTWQQSTVAGCTGGSMAGCDEVLTSTWSKWFGIPVSLIGALVYTGILTLCWPAVISGGWAMTAFLTLVMLAGGAAVWFISTQAFLLEHYCLYCMTVHTCGLLVATATFYLIRDTDNGESVDHMRAFFGANDEPTRETSSSVASQPLIAAGIAMLGLAALIGGQMFFAGPSLEVIENPSLEVVAEPQEAKDETAATEAGASEPATIEPPPSEPSQVEPAGDAVVVSDEDTDEPAVGEGSENSAEKAPEKLAVVAEVSPTITDVAEPASDPVANLGSRYFRFKYLARQIDAAGNPVLGNPYAERRMVEMMDYTCPHCRKFHPYIREAVERYGDQIGFVIYHVPLSRKCNPLVERDQAIHQNACDYAKLAYGVWKVTPQRFAEFHNWLLEGDKAPPLFEARRKALELAGDAVLIDKSIEIESNRRVGASAAELEPLKVGLPVLIFDEGIIRGIPDSEEEWFKLLENRMGMKPLVRATN